MTEPVVLSDYSPITDNDAALCETIQQLIQQRACNLVDLLDGGTRTAPPPEIFRREPDGVWWTQQYIGLFEYQGKRVIINSRFHDQPFFLWYLMESFLDESLLALEDVASAYGDDLFDALLAAKLAVQLQRAWKKGSLRTYRTFDHNDSRVRGQLDVSRHIRENLGLNNGRAAYRTREYSADNAWNVLFLQAVEAAHRRQPSLLRRLERRLPEFRAALRALKQAIPHWSSLRQDWVLKHTRQTIPNPIYRDYEAARLTAQAILRRMGLDLSGASGSVVTGVFLDINTLWERLLEDQLFYGAPGPFSQQSKKILNGHMEICPDFLWQDRGVVLDAKNRLAWTHTLSCPGKWSDSDLLSKADQTAIQENMYQLFSYMLNLGCTDGGVIFPVSGDQSYDPIPDPLGPAGNQFWRIPVRIPKATDYSTFRQELEAELTRLRTKSPIQRVIAP